MSSFQMPFVLVYKRTYIDDVYHVNAIVNIITNDDEEVQNSMADSRLKKEILARRFRICELAKRAGVNVSRMSRFVNGWEVPPKVRRQKIARILGVHEEKIWRGGADE